MKIFALLFITILMINCAKRDAGSELIILKKKALSSKGAITRKWLNDSTGCEGKRMEILNRQSIPFDSILGLKTRFVIKYLGEPNYIQKTNNRLFYNIECKYAPPIFNLTDNEGKLTKRTINTYAQVIFLEFNSDSTIIKKGGMIF